MHPHPKKLTIFWKPWNIIRKYHKRSVRQTHTTPKKTRERQVQVSVAAYHVFINFTVKNRKAGFSISPRPKWHTSKKKKSTHIMPSTEASKFSCHRLEFPACLSPRTADSQSQFLTAVTRLPPFFEPTVAFCARELWVCHLEGEMVEETAASFPRNCTS